MHIAYTTTFNAHDVHNWSGTPYYMSKAFTHHGIDVDYIGSLQRKLPRFFKSKQIINKYLLQQRESPRFNVTAAKHYSSQVARQLQHLSVDAIVSPLINPIAYLDCKQPIVLWTDAVYAALLGFYAPFSAHSAASIAQGNAITQACLARCQLAIFASDWAAQNAIQLYGTNKNKVKVVPFGANLDAFPNYLDIKNMIKQRSQNKIKLLFLAKSWERKGGDIVLSVADALYAQGYHVELNIVGYYPPKHQQLPAYVNCLGFISKHTALGKQKLLSLFAENHFLFVPSRAEAYGIVFCEANAFAMPCLTTYVGGISTIVKDDINGKTFALDAPLNNYCDYIINVMNNRSRYESLALSAYHEFTTRLNWQSAVQNVKTLMKELLE